MTYSSVTCFYASGTGNSFRAAKWLAEEAAAGGAKAAIVPVDEKGPFDLHPGDKQLVGIYHPAHGLMPPWSMIRFLLFSLPWGRGAHGVVVSTRGGIPIPKWVIPGGGGMAFVFPLLILFLKGYHMQGGISIDMPCNVINIHWSMTEQNARRVIAVGERNHRRFAKAVLKGNRFLSPVNVLWELIWCIPFILFPVLPIIYLVVSRVLMAKVMFADTSCTGCGACARQCPRGAIRMPEKETKNPFWTHRCEACLRCMGYCKHHAVQASHIWAFVTAWVTSLLSVAFVFNIQEKIVPTISPLPNWLAWIISIGLVYAALVAMYYPFFMLLKIKPIKVLFTYTTLTKLYRRRYHEPDIKAKEMRNIISM